MGATAGRQARAEALSLRAFADAKFVEGLQREFAPRSVNTSIKNALGLRIYLGNVPVMESPRHPAANESDAPFGVVVPEYLYQRSIALLLTSTYRKDRNLPSTSDHSVVR